MARSYTSRESGSPTLSAEAANNIILARAKQALSSLKESLKLKESEEKELSEKRIGFISAYERDRELAEAIKDGTVDKLKNDRDDPDSPFSMANQEKAMKGLIVERGVLYDKYNRLISVMDGEYNKADIAYANKEQMIGGTVTHNHPEGSASLSPQDVVSLLWLRLGRMRAVGEKLNDVGDIRYVGEGDPKGFNDKKVAEFASNIPSMWIEMSQKIGLGFLMKFQRENKEAYKVLKEKEKWWDVMDFRPKTPEGAKIINGIIKPEIEERWRMFIASSLQDFGYEYTYNNKPVIG